MTALEHIRRHTGRVLWRKAVLDRICTEKNPVRQAFLVKMIMELEAQLDATNKA